MNVSAIREIIRRFILGLFINFPSLRAGEYPGSVVRSDSKNIAPPEYPTGAFDWASYATPAGRTTNMPAQGLTLETRRGLHQERSKLGNIGQFLQVQDGISNRRHMMDWKSAVRQLFKFSDNLRFARKPLFTSARELDGLLQDRFVL